MTNTTLATGAQHVADTLATMTLTEKVQLLTGGDIWSTRPLERLGLRRMVLSDGPSGVRGEGADERDPSLNLPSATLLASSWDCEMARRYGAVAALEARRKNVDVVLGPTINLHRSPLGGRHFECFSEDPVLTGEMAAAYVSGMQDNGVGATPKHYVANDAETDRFTVDNRIDPRTLREVYLLAFEKSIRDARAWLVMSAYNGVNGVTMTANDLLETPLNSEWGFDGVVVSDWTAARSLESAKASQDLLMPGPDGPWGDALIDAVRTGQISESVVDRKVARILTLAQRVGAIEGFEPAAPVWVEDGAAFAREAAIEGTVLLTNKAGALPWDASALTSLAVIGDNAVNARTQGGGSAMVLPPYTVSPLAGLRSALPDVEVTYSPGCIVRQGLADFPLDQLTNPVTGEPGVRTRFLDDDGRELLVEDRRASSLLYFGSGVPIEESSTFELRTQWVPPTSGRVNVGFALLGPAKLYVGGELILEETLLPQGGDIGASMLSPPYTSAEIKTTAGEPVEIRCEYDIRKRTGYTAILLSVSVGTQPARVDEDELIADAARAAEAADVALIVVGTNSVVESEGYDRTSLALPGRQDDLVRAVAAANPRTVVLVNAGSPVLLPWRDEVAAVLVGYFGGQEMGNALADVLLGVAEPGGRLPTTWPAAEADVPVLNTTPTDGRLDYSEGIHIGYRGWLRQQAAPAYWFGSGLGYTDIAVTSASASVPPTATAGSPIQVSAQVHNTGSRSGKQVVQVYAERSDSVVDRPVRWLVGFAPVRVAAGKTADITIDVPTRLLAYWSQGWQYEAGDYVLRVGTSSVDLPYAVTVSLP